MKNQSSSERIGNEKNSEFEKLIQKANMIAIARMLLRAEFFSLSEYNKIMIEINKKYKSKFE